MKHSLFNVLEAIIDNTEYTEFNLSKPEYVIEYAESMGRTVYRHDADKIIEVGHDWLYDMKNGNGEWSRMYYKYKGVLDSYED